MGLLHHSLCHYELVQDELLGVLTPPVPCFLQVAVFDGEEELGGILDRIVVKVFLTSSCPDSLEHLSAEGHTGNRANDIACILFLAHEAYPLHEDILDLGNVNIAGLATLERRESFLKVARDLVATLRRRVKL